MTKSKKEAKPCSLRMDEEIFNRLNEYCERTGASKTRVIEKALCAFFNEDERKQRILQEAECK